MLEPNEHAEGRLDEYLDRLGHVIGHRDRQGPLRAYLSGLLLQGERKSVEPMAARIDPYHVSARHQSMHHLVASAPWDDEEVLRTARDYLLPFLKRHAPVGAWIIDDTGMPKKGTHSVGVARQYCGAVGKQENCQVVVTVSLPNAVMSVPAAYRLYLPESWAKSKERREEAGVPKEVTFQTKWEIALTQIDGLLSDGEVAMAGGAGLRRDETGTWTRPLRGSWMEGVPSPRRSLHRGLRLPRRGAREAFPSRASGLSPSGCVTRGFPPTRRPRQGRNGITHAPAPANTSSPPAPWSALCPAVHGAEAENSL